MNESDVFWQEKINNHWRLPYSFYQVTSRYQHNLMMNILPLHHM